MHVALVGPVATEDVAAHLDADAATLPVGHPGAPLMGTLVTELLQRGHRVSVFTTSHHLTPGPRHRVAAVGGDRFAIHYTGLRPHAFRPRHGRLGRAADLFALERACLREAIATAAPDVVHAHWTYEFGLAAIESGLPHVVTCHDAPREVLRHIRTLYRLARYAMAVRCLADARLVSAVSPYLAEQIRVHRDGPIEVVPNPLPHASLRPLPARRGSRGGAPVVAMVMNGWGPMKNPETALHAFARLRAAMPGATLLAFGQGYGPGERAQVWAVANGLADGVHFVGRLAHARLLERLRDADLLLHPSRLEACPMAVVEAMAAGLPVVGGAASGGVPWVVGDGGLLVDVGSAQAMAEALVRILGDDALHRRLGAAARARACAVFSPTAVVAGYEALYARACGRRALRRDAVAA